MATNLERKTTSGLIRPGLSQVQPTTEVPSSPHTPQKYISSTFSSPAASYRTEEDCLVFEFGSRYFRAGYAGESAPRCVSKFGPEESRRVGDYRRWLPEYEQRPRKRKLAQDWGNDHELWRMDLRDVDLGLVEDKVERAVREAYNQYLLLDSKSRRLLLVLPSVIPLPLLSTILFTLFNKYQNPSITLLPGPIMAAVAAGLRSCLTIDIGWRESVITGVYEYREVLQRRTSRAMKLVTLEMAKLLQRESKTFGRRIQVDSMSEEIYIDFEHAEDVTTRLAWCQSRAVSRWGHPLMDDLSALNIEEKQDENRPSSPDKLELNTMISVPLNSSSTTTANIPFINFSHPVDEALFVEDKGSYDLDDHEHSLPLLIYQSLLSLAPDVRGLCMSRIIITGGGSNIPGLKTRLIDEVSLLVQKRQWDPARGKAADEHRHRLQEITSYRSLPPRIPDHPGKREKTPEDESQPPENSVLAAFESQIPDPIADKLRRDEVRLSKPIVSGVIRGVETLGSWVGASLIAGLKIKGVVEIERDSFLQHGLSGAKKDADVSVQQQRQSLGPGLPRPGGSERVSWTLGAWA